MYATAQANRMPEPVTTTKCLGEIEETTTLLRNNVELVEQAVLRLGSRLGPVQRSEPNAADGNSRPTPAMTTPLGSELYTLAERLFIVKGWLDLHADRLEI